MFLLGVVRDPDAQGAVVSSVKLTNDLSLARVFMRLVELDPSEDRKKALLKKFGSLRGVREASVDEVASTLGFTQALATKVKASI